MGDGKTDSQLINSVYLDNDTLELYTGRLEKTHEAIALRFRWYGDGRPEDGKVFVERKTHRDSSSILNSEKERFIVSEPEVIKILKGEFDVEEKVERMKRDGKSEAEINSYQTLASEVCDVVVERKLRPMMRTQYLRTAFQIPYDASVRVSMDTNLTLFLDSVEDTIKNKRWYRNPDIPIPQNEITVFPHAVVEIKLQLKDKDDTPPWLLELIESGKLIEMHKFSKFVHGCAVIMPLEVSAFPYWIDDETIKQSIEVTRQAAGFGLKTSNKDVESGAIDKKIVMRKKLSPSASSSSAATASPIWQSNGGCISFCGFTMQSFESAVTEPKVFMANERTFITWLSMSALLTSISLAILAFSKTTQYAQIYGLVLLPIALLFDMYALRTYIWRGDQIRSKRSSSWGDPNGPIYITLALIAVLVAQLVAKIVQLQQGTKKLR